MSDYPVDVDIQEDHMGKADTLNSCRVGGEKYRYYDIRSLGVDSLPYSLRVLLENLLRNHDGKVVTDDHVNALLNRRPGEQPEVDEVPFFPARVLMQDFTGVPAIVDLSALRDAVKEAGRDPALINPQIPVDLVVDHSVQIDYYGSPEAAQKNVAFEYKRNTERYELLKWAQQQYENFRVVPPNSGICHQVNLEYLAQLTREDGGVLYPDSLVGTDSHTTMINGLGVFGWGVGGIEAEAVMLSQPYFMPIPKVYGVKLTGTMDRMCTATDLVLHITELLRDIGVVGSFVEFFGDALGTLSLPDRATIANMSPEYGATMGFFPIDEQSIEYLRLTGRQQEAERTEIYAKANGLFHDPGHQAAYDQVVEVDLGAIEPSIAGPSRPQDRIPLSRAKTECTSFILDQHTEAHTAEVVLDATRITLEDGTLAIAAITSCTNTSNPAVMIGAGLLARKAVSRGLKSAPWVKTSLAPGSKVVTEYLHSSGLLKSLEQLGFNIAAYGCTTCIGNSGPLNKEIEQAQIDHDLILAAALSGNRNFEGRIHPRVKASYLMSPILVVAYALAGRVTIDFEHEPIGTDREGKQVYLRDIWPDASQIHDLQFEHMKNQLFSSGYDHIFSGDHFWKELDTPEGKTFSWNPKSTYIAQPPFFTDFSLNIPGIEPIENAKALLLMYDSVTTDHISPAGAIDPTYPAGRYLSDLGVTPDEFNSYGSRRGNHEVMMRGTFGNTRIKQALTAPSEGGFTRKLPSQKLTHIFDVAMEYKREHTDLIILAGREYGTGSSRDWAAKGTQLLGVRAVIAESFERIHRSNLVGMGVLPLTFTDGQSWKTLELTGEESYKIDLPDEVVPKQPLTVEVQRPDGSSTNFEVICRLDSPIEVTYYRNGGILPYVLRRLLSS
jgi:aconitate hydratase